MPNILSLISKPAFWEGRIEASGTFAGNVNENAVIPAGTQVCSYYVQLDRVTNGYTQGAMEFPNAQILGVITSNGNLIATDDLLGNDGTTYGGNRGTEGHDEINLSLTENKISWDIYVAGNTYTDDFRVLTSC